MIEDQRKAYLLSTAANFFGKDVDDLLRYSDNKNLVKFLDDLNVLLLIVNIATNNKEVTFTCKVGLFVCLFAWVLVVDKKRCLIVVVGEYIVGECVVVPGQVARLLQVQLGDDHARQHEADNNDLVHHGLAHRHSIPSHTQRVRARHQASADSQVQGLGRLRRQAHQHAHRPRVQLAHGHTAPGERRVEQAQCAQSSRRVPVLGGDERTRQVQGGQGARRVLLHRVQAARRPLQAHPLVSHTGHMRDRRAHARLVRLRLATGRLRAAVLARAHDQPARNHG